MIGQMRQTTGGTGVWCIDVCWVNRTMFMCVCVLKLIVGGTSKLIYFHES